MTPEDVAEVEQVAFGLIWNNPCGCVAWMGGTHAAYWRMPEPENEFHGVSECVYCEATWGLFDSHRDEMSVPPWQRPAEPVGAVEPVRSIYPGVSVWAERAPDPLGPVVRERTP